VKLNANRRVSGTLRGYDQFMNIVLDDAVEASAPEQNMGMVVIRGNSVLLLEPLEPIVSRYVPFTGSAIPPPVSSGPAGAVPQ
jgi:small nuclear ribonucleoprotein G